MEAGRVDPKKALVIGVLLIVLLYFLHPTRRLALNAFTATDAEIVEITFMSPGGPVAGTLADVIAEFERISDEENRKDPTKPVYRVVSGQNAARDQVADPTRFLVSLAGGVPPDVIMFDRYAVSEWAARNAFTPLDDFITRDLAAGRPDTPVASNFYPAAWDEATYKGRPFGIPISIDNRALVVNRTALRRAGLVDEKGEVRIPRTWEQIREFSRKLTTVEYIKTLKQVSLEQYFAETGKTKLDTREARLITVGFLPMWGNSWLYIYGWMNGGEFLNADGTRITLNDPKIVEALQWLVAMYEEMGGYATANSFQAGFQGGSQDPFITGKVAMLIHGVWYMNDLGRFGRDLDFVVVPPPVPQARLEAGFDKVSWTGGWAYSIPATSKKKDAAWELIRFLASEYAVKLRIEADRQLAEAEGRFFLPTQSPDKRINDWQYESFVYTQASIPQKYKDGMRAFNDLLPFSRFRPNTPVGQTLWNQHVTRTEEALYPERGKSPQVALDEGTAIAQRELDRFVNPTPGTPIRSWNWMLIIYAGLLAVTAVLVYRWDTNVGFRSNVGRWFGLSRASREAVIDGASGSYMRRYWLGGLVCVSPWLVGFIIFGGGPMLFSLVLSFCRYDIVNTAEFVGMENYRRLFTQDELIGKSLLNTLYMVIAVPLGMIAGLGIALLLNQGVKGVAFWRTVFYLPAVIPGVVMAILWIWLLNPQIGLVNRVLEYVGISGPMWLQSPEWSKPSLILMGLWGAGGGMVVWLAGLKSIPSTLYEAASVDGAGPIRQFVSVTIPQLTPYIFFNLVMGLIGTFQIFDQAFIMTQGGPVDSTLFYVYHLFNNAFRYGQMGYASAMAWVLFAIVLALTIFQMKMSKRWVHYEED